MLGWLLAFIPTIIILVTMLYTYFTYTGGKNKTVLQVWDLAEHPILLITSNSFLLLFPETKRSNATSRKLGPNTQEH